jgi:hypothetical protein
MLFFFALFFFASFGKQKTLVNTQKRGTGAPAYKFSSLLLFFFSLRFTKEKQKMAQKISLPRSPKPSITHPFSPKSPIATNPHATSPSPPKKKKSKRIEIVLTHLLPPSRNPQSNNNNKPPPRPPPPPPTNKTPRASTKLRFSTRADPASEAAAVVSVTGAVPVLVGVAARR